MENGASFRDSRYLAMMQWASRQLRNAIQCPRCRRLRPVTICSAAWVVGGAEGTWSRCCGERTRILESRSAD